MKKCTLCIDKIYNENLEEVDRVPACVSTCPAGARHFGDLNDPESDVSILVSDRQGYDLLPELGYKPTNKYLPPRPRRDHVSKEYEQVSILNMANSDGSNESNETNNPLLKWVDAVLSR
jgi:Fe-S-cluster-containing dehydrogenase component